MSVHHLEAHCLVARLAATRIEDVETKSSIEMPNANRNDEHSDSSSGSIGEKFTPRVEYPFLALVSPKQCQIICLLYYIFLMLPHSWYLVVTRNS